jgi:hypothetical protein
MLEQQPPQTDESKTANVDSRFALIIARGREVLQLRQARGLRISDHAADFPANPTEPLDPQAPR